MKKLLITCVALAAMTAPSLAGEVTINFPDNIDQTFHGMQGMLDLCIGATLRRDDASSCQNLHSILVQLEHLPTKPVAADTPAPAPAPTPTPTPTDTPKQ